MPSSDNTDNQVSQSATAARCSTIQPFHQETDVCLRKNIHPAGQEKKAEFLRMISIGGSHGTGQCGTVKHHMTSQA